MSKKPMPRYFADAKLVPRVRQYVESQSHPRSIDIAVMAESLQNQYSDYRRKKRSAFFKSVKKAYASLNTRSKLPEVDPAEKLEMEYLARKLKSNNRQEKSDDENSVSLSSDDMECIVYEDTNAINSLVSDCYRKTAGTNASFTVDRIGTPARLDSAKTGSSVKSLGESVNDTSGFATPMKDATKITEEAPPKDVPKAQKKRKKSSAITDDDGSKKARKVVPLTKPTATFADIGGSDTCLMDVCRLLLHMKHPEIYAKLGVRPPRGLLLHGPPGCGKTLLANAIAGEMELPFVKVAAPEIIKGVSGESEEMLRDLFDMATSVAPSIVFIDEIDAITPKREVASKDMERRIVAQLLTCLDDLNASSSNHVLVIGATNRADSLDPALRRAGRFDREICLGIPDEDARNKILRVLCRDLCLAPHFDYNLLARNTPGYVGADLTALTREAAINAVNRVFKTLNAPMDSGSPQPPSMMDINSHSVSQSFSSVLSWLKDTPPLNDEQLSDLCFTMDDFNAALKVVVPSAKREGFATVPDVTWSDIGALREIREELQLAILAPVKHREDFESLGLNKPPGVLLAGPPGCGKTLLAKAIANESGINFISVKGPELLNMYVGESERAVRQVFQRAANSSPCVIFFDELDALCPRRGSAGESGSSTRVVNQMLTEMDGLEERRRVFVMAATNRPDIIDPAILRPGRLDKLLYVGLPCLADRLDILSTITKNGTKPSLAEDVSLHDVAEKCDGYTGADLAAVVREASVIALKDRIAPRTTPEPPPTRALLSPVQVNREHLSQALVKVTPSVSNADQERYLKLRQRLSV